MTCRKIARTRALPMRLNANGIARAPSCVFDGAPGQFVVVVNGEVGRGAEIVFRAGDKHKRGAEKKERTDGKQYFFHVMQKYKKKRQLNGQLCSK